MSIESFTNSNASETTSKMCSMGCCYAAIRTGDHIAIVDTKDMNQGAHIVGIDEYQKYIDDVKAGRASVIDVFSKPDQYASYLDNELDAAERDIHAGLFDPYNMKDREMVVAYSGASCMNNLVEIPSQE